MVTAAAEQKLLPVSGTRPKRRVESPSWLLPGPAVWEFWDQSAGGQSVLVAELPEEESRLPKRPSMVALPSKSVTCQLLWVETADDRDIPDLVRMQCERRALIRDNEVWKYRPLARAEGRILVQTLILGNTVPGRAEVDGAPRFEALARCLDLPPNALCLWRELGQICVALSNAEGEAAFFQALPHRALGRECLRDLNALCLLALAQGWVSSLDECVAAGPEEPEVLEDLRAVIELPARSVERFGLRVPKVSMRLTPRSVRQRQKQQRRSRRIQAAAVAVALLYGLFLAGQIVWGVWRAAANRSLEAKLNAIMPQVQEMQGTARQLDALNPAIDVRTYPIEILYRLMALLPEKGVRLTRFEIVGNRIEITGESATAREAFDFMKSIQESPDLQYIHWEEPPQPVPLPNDTTRFSIRGEIQGAFHEET